ELESKFVYSSFDWKQGSVKSESISVKSDNNQFSLNLQAGTNITALDNMSVRVGNEYYTAVKKDPGKTIDDYDLAENEVLVDIGTGELTFKDNLSKGSDIEVKYVTDYQVDTMTTPEEGTTIKLSNEQISKGSVSLTIGDDDNYTINDSGKVINDGVEVGTINYDEGIITMNDEHAIAADTEVKVKYNYDYINFGIGAHTEEGFKDEIFNIKASQSFDSMVSEVNRADNGVSMFYDEMTGQISLTRTETGNFNDSGDEIKTSGDFAINQLNFSDTTEETGGQNAKFTLNGLTTERTSNSFEVSGVTFNLKQEFSGENVRVNITNDTEAVFENIKGFVEKYNELIGKIQDRLQEERHRDYRPLTDKQREAMTERQQKLWEEKAKSGMLRRDPILSGALNDMRRDFYTQVENSGIP